MWSFRFSSLLITVISIFAVVGAASAQCGADPLFLNFGFSPPGEPVVRTLMLSNDGEATVSGELVISTAYAGEFVFADGGAEWAYQLGAGQSVDVDVVFTPIYTYNRYASIDLGPIGASCGTANVACEGFGATAPPPGDPQCSISDWAGLNFPNTVVGETSTETLRMTAFYGGRLEVFVPYVLGDFAVPTGGLGYVIDSRFWQVHFTPSRPGWHEESFAVPTVCQEQNYPPMRFIGLGLVQGEGCQVLATDLEFGNVPVGGSATGVVKILNIGTDYLELDLPSSCGPFRVVDGGGFMLLQSGTQRNIVISFEPTVPGLQSCVLDLGQPLCDPVTMNGLAFENVGTADQLGIWFEETGTIDRHTTTTDFEEVTAYLMVVNPSVDYGISGWECCVEVAGAVFGLTWELAGDAINVEASPCFSVGVSGPPLPGDQLVMLATLTFYQPNPHAQTAFYIHPASSPSLPGVAVYADGIDPGHLVPMMPASGSETVPVAVVNEELTGLPDPVYVTDLIEARPNPFNPSTTIRFELAEEGSVDLSVFDVRGRCVDTIVNEVLPRGEHELLWNGRSASGRQLESGVYFVRLAAGGERRIMKLMLLK